MNEIKLFEEKNIELKNGEIYYIIKQTIFNNNLYLLANKLKETEDIGEDVFVLRIENTEEELNVELETDPIILSEILNIFSDLM